MNIHTLHIEHVVMLAIYTLLTVANSWMYKNMKGIHWFSLYNLFALLGAIAVVLRGQIPDFFSIVAGNVLVMGAYFVLLLSLASLFGRGLSAIYLQALLFVMGLFTMVEYGTIHPDTRLRLIAYSLILGFQQAHIAFYVFRRTGGPFRRGGLSIGVILACLATANLIRLLGVGYQGAPSNYLQAGNFLASIVVANTCLQCGAMVAYVWLTAALLRRDLEVQASTDPLTGLLNRRAIERAAEAAIAACSQTGLSVSAITIDLDGFKQINDTHGHASGDAILIAVARDLQKSLRETDLLARIGGDEFAILLPQTTLPQAGDIAERLRDGVDSLQIACAGTTARITASFGVAQVDGSDWDRLMTQCDSNLYAAKRAGGNLTSAVLIAHEAVTSLPRLATG